MIYADFDFYKNEYIGSIVPEADFPRLAKRASDFLDYYTLGRAAKHAHMDAVKLACCAVAEQGFLCDRALQLAARRLDAEMQTGGAEVTSETVGSWSRSYRGAGESAAALRTAANERTAMAEAAARYLAHTGLLARGVCWR